MRIVSIALGCPAGIILAANSSTRLTLIWLALAGLSLIVVALLWRGGRMAAFCLLAFTLGGLRLSLVPTTSAIAAYNNSGGLTVEGIVVDAPDVRDNFTLLRLAAETVTRAGVTAPTEGLVLVRAPSTAHAQNGNRVRATGLLITPAEFDTFSYADYLARSGVYSIMSRASVEVLSGGHGDPVNGDNLNRIRAANFAFHRKPSFLSIEPNFVHKLLDYALFEFKRRFQNHICRAYLLGNGEKRISTRFKFLLRNDLPLQAVQGVGEIADLCLHSLTAHCKFLFIECAR